jgi:hypothetical protein
MAITLQDATVATFIQTIAAVSHLLKRGRAHCEANAIDLTGVLGSRIHPNMHFHAKTAYDLLRGQGVPLGKGDYLGRIKLKT